VDLDDVDELDLLSKAGPYFTSPYKHHIVREIQSNYSPSKQESVLHTAIGKRIQLNQDVRRGILTAEEAALNIETWLLGPSAEAEDENRREEMDEEDEVAEDEDEVDEETGLPHSSLIVDDEQDYLDSPPALDPRLRSGGALSSPPRFLPGPLSSERPISQEDDGYLGTDMDHDSGWSTPVIMSGGTLARVKGSRSSSLPSSKVRRKRMKLCEDPRGKEWSRFYEILRLEFVGRVPARPKDMRSEDSQEHIFIRDLYYQFFGKNAPPMADWELHNVMSSLVLLIVSAIKPIAV
jgi:hypothetical protein